MNIASEGAFFELLFIRDRVDVFAQARCIDVSLYFCYPRSNYDLLHTSSLCTVFNAWTLLSQLHSPLWLVAYLITDLVYRWGHWSFLVLERA
jgi:hypothetical protein